MNERTVLTVCDLIYKHEALHAVLNNEGQAAIAAIENIKPVNLMDYPLDKLLLFAQACKQQGVRPEDLKNVVTDITWGAKVAYAALDKAIKQTLTHEAERAGSYGFTIELPPPINTERHPFLFDFAPEVLMPEMRTSSIKDIDMRKELSKIEERIIEQRREQKRMIPLSIYDLKEYAGMSIEERRSDRGREIREELEKRMLWMPARWRKLIRYRYILGYTAVKTARMVGISERSVTTWTKELSNWLADKDAYLRKLQ